VRTHITWLRVLVVAAGVTALIVLYCFDPRQHGWYPPCPVHWGTGLHCPGCGSLRAIHTLMHGDVASATSYNVMTVVVIAVAIGIGLTSVVERVTRSTARRARLPGILIHGVTGLILLFAVLRNIPASPFHYLAP
jgi:hypothetical protein